MRNPAFEKLLENWKKIHNSKNTDYAKIDDPYYNLRGCEDAGIPAWKGVVVRMTDKMSRLKNLTRNPNGAKNEPIEDTFDDLGIYSALGKLLYQEWAKKAKLPVYGEMGGVRGAYGGKPFKICQKKK